MAIIPKANINMMQSTDVTRRPTQSIEAAGLVGKGIESFAKGLGDVGQAYLQINKQQEKLAAESYANKKTIEAEIEAKKRIEQLKLETKGDHKDFFANSQKIFDEVEAKYLQGTDGEKPNELGKQVFASRFSSIKRRMSLNSLDYQTNQRTNYLYKQDQETDMLKANSLAVSPDPIAAMKYIKDSEASYNNPSKYQGDIAQKGVLSARNSIFEGLMSGFENSDDPDTALSILNNEMAESKELLKNIDEGKIQTWRRRFQNLSNINTSVKASVLNKQFTDAEAAIMDRMQSVDNNELTNLQQMYAAAGDTNKVQSVEMLKASNALMQQLKTTPNKELDKILTKGVENLPEFKVTGSMNAAEKVRLSERFKTSIQKLKELKESRGADFIHDTFADVQNIAAQAADIGDIRAMNEYSTKVIEHQNKQNINNPKVLTDKLAEVYTSQINISKNPDLGAGIAANNIQKLKAGYGEHSLKIAKELVDRKLITSEQAYAFYLDNPESVKRLMELQDPKVLEAVNKAYTLKKSEDVDVDLTMSKLSTDETFTQFKSALVDKTGQQSNIQITESLLGIMQKDYKQIVTTSSIKPEEAKKQVIERYMNNWKITSNSTPVVIPNVEVQKHGYNVDKIEDNIDELRTSMPFMQESLNIPVPDTYIKELGKDAPAKWKKDLSNRSRWVTSPEMDGVVLMVDMGGKNPLAVKNKDGGLIRVSYKELNQGFDLSKGQKPEGVIGAVYKHRQRLSLDKPFIRTAEIGRQF